MQCYWTISATSSLRAVVYFSSEYLSSSKCGGSTSSGGGCSMRIESHNTCNYDFLTALYGDALSTDYADKSILTKGIFNINQYRLCGNSLPAPNPMYTTSQKDYSISWYLSLIHISEPTRPY
eukprot:TRINITY_DN28916_c0_g2_i1.p1 TRINITY_DN28916_c0_g2~~TRINITY_DN28916_c0_g2_i1.p1  ORF type:complete len:122 (-),score=32.84 TRINITY_DN28916_c0_g2_i1:53-418(-)